MRAHVVPADSAEHFLCSNNNVVFIFKCSNINS